MEKRDNKQASNLFIWGLFAALTFHNMVIPVVSNSKFEGKNHKYFPHLHSGTPSQGSVSACKCSPPSHGTSPSPGSPPPRPRPPHGISPPYGGGHTLPCTPPPSSPRSPISPVIGTPTIPIIGAPRRPIIGTPTTPIIGAPKSPIITTPTTPIISTPTIPGYPRFPAPTPPFLSDPNTPFSGTCEFWRTHPSLIWGLCGWWATVDDVFGMSTVPAGSISPGPNLLEALSNTKSDGLAALYREGTASLLNSMVNQRFHFTSKQVKDSFIAAHGSEKAAMAQAQIFKLANEGRLKPRA